MSEFNKNGLSRDIPSGVKREVRQRDGFGCVICGKAIIQYDHFSPEYVDATEHNPDGIILLCSEHHSKKTTGMLSRETIEAAARNPRARQKGFSFEAFDIGVAPPKIVLGQLAAYNVRVIIEFNGEEILSILPPETSGAPFRINARLRDRNGNLILEIVENEWRTPCENWDVEVSGPRIKIWKEKRDVILEVQSAPPKGLVFKKLDMQYCGHRIVFDEKSGMFIENSIGLRNYIEGADVDGSDVAIDVSDGHIGIGRGGGKISFRALKSSRAPKPAASMIRYFMKPLINVVPSTQRRNDECACGSGLRFKRCCGKIGDC